MNRLKILDLKIELLTRGALDDVHCGAFSDFYPSDFPFNGTDLVLTRDGRSVIFSRYKGNVA